MVRRREAVPFLSTCKYFAPNCRAWGRALEKKMAQAARAWQKMYKDGRFLIRIYPY